MSKVVNNPLLKGVSGMLGKQIVFRELRGQIIMANRPKKPGTSSEHQEQTKARFLKAVQYARKQLLSEQSKAEYATGITLSKHSAYLVALTDYMKSPEVNAIETLKYKGVVGDIISIRATDDFKVAAVLVIITSSTGMLIEQGEAIIDPTSFDEWRYAVTTANASLPGTKITAQATDKPGNVGTLEVTLP